MCKHPVLPEKTEALTDECDAYFEMLTGLDQEIPRKKIQIPAASVCGCFCLLPTGPVSSPDIQNSPLDLVLAGTVHNIEPPTYDFNLEL